MSHGELVGTARHPVANVLTSLKARLNGAARLGRLDSQHISVQAVVVWLVWVAALVWVGAAFIARFGYNLPACDEWAFVQVSYGPWHERLEWLFSPHMEHRFPLGRLIYLGLLEATGHDYRAGMWVTFAFLGGAAAALIAAARRFRGRTTLADAAFPLLLLHNGHTENLLMGYQLVFTLTVLGLGLFALVVAWAGPEPQPRHLLIAALLLAVIATGGWLGLVFVPPLGLWIALQTWRLSRSPHAAETRWGRIAVVDLLAIVALYGLVMLWILVDPLRDTPRPARPAIDLLKRLRALAEVAAIALGPGIGWRHDVGRAGTVILAIQTVSTVALFVVGARRPAERPVAWGLLALFLGVWVFEFGVGFMRGSGLASRYTSFTCLGLAIPLLAVARYWPGMAPSWIAAAIVAFGAYYYIVPSNKHGKCQGLGLEKHYQLVLDGAHTDMPIDVLAARHVNFFLGTSEGWQSLWEHQFPLVARVPKPLTITQRLPLTVSRNGEVRDPEGMFDRYRVTLSGPRTVAAVRVKFQASAQTTFEPIRLEWDDPATGEHRVSRVYPWVRPMPQETVFWIDGPFAGGDLIMGRESCRFEILGVEAER